MTALQIERSQEFAREDKTAVQGTEVPQRGPEAEPRWGSRATPPETGDTVMLNILLNKAIDRRKSRTVQSPIIL